MDQNDETNQKHHQQQPHHGPAHPAGHDQPPTHQPAEQPRSDWQHEVLMSLRDHPNAAPASTTAQSTPIALSELPPADAEPSIPPADTEPPAPSTYAAAQPEALPPAGPGQYAEDSRQYAAEPEPVAAGWQPDAPANQNPFDIPPQSYDHLPPPDRHYDEEALAPTPVVQVVSPRGVEYAMLTLALWVGALSLLGALLSLINGAGFEALAFPSSSLLVSLPVFAFFFLRLKRAEVARPELALDPSKRRLTQFTQLIAFAVCLFTLIAFVDYVIMKIGGQGGTSFLKALLDVIAILAVAGGILAYYWFDEHPRR